MSDIQRRALLSIYMSVCAVVISLVGLILSVLPRDESGDPRGKCEVMLLPIESGTDREEADRKRMDTYVLEKGWVPIGYIPPLENENTATLVLRKPRS